MPKSSWFGSNVPGLTDSTETIREERVHFQKRIKPRVLLQTDASVNREVTMTTLALEAHTQQVTGIVVITGSAEESAPPARHSHHSAKAWVGVISIIFGTLSVAMTVFGILDYNLCPGHTRLAIYMIVQGATSVVIPILALCWCCCTRISGTFITATCAIIGLFNIGWGITGTIWLTKSSCLDTLLHVHAVGFSIPLWIFFCLVCGCSRREDDDDDD
ncbi:uncharacterized protein LOC124292298 isoform X1 [Haliotis rubra]|uniref:uncharacterized protein LOC124292298 isoform X1 n=1 Tax=Haliotis rubra TaxID=36100 RepID=UPI001EE567E6|nr:uncharacterized protein LOC124292298 isoform X1 [Haliotis rubra]